MRHGWLLLSIFCLSCHALTSAEPEGMPPESNAGLAPALAETDVAMPPPSGMQLAQFVATHQDEPLLRARFAELLFGQKHLPEAQAEFERYVAAAQDDEGAARHVIHCHSRLMEIAEECEDGYAEHLHRGIGLYLLAREREALPDPDEALPVEALLCKAAAELSLARRERGGEARPCWYLHEVWSHLGQSQPARRWLREAVAEAPFSYLTPCEQRRLTLAWQRLRDGEARW